jgi:hypothetical protein
MISSKKGIKKPKNKILCLCSSDVMLIKPCKTIALGEAGVAITVFTNSGYCI